MCCGMNIELVNGKLAENTNIFSLFGISTKNKRNHNAKPAKPPKMNLKYKMKSSLSNKIEIIPLDIFNAPTVKNVRLSAGLSRQIPLI